MLKFQRKCVLIVYDSRHKREKLLLPEMRVTRKILTQAAANLFPFINSLVFSIQSLNLKTHFNSTTRSPTFYCLKRKKRQFVRTNLIVKNCFNGEFYWRKVFHYGFKIQILTWTYHCRSQNLQPARSLKH